MYSNCQHFTYADRRARQEIVASINAVTEQAAASHQQLANFHATRAAASISGLPPIH